MRRKRKNIFLAMAILCVLIVRPMPAQATLVTIGIEAVVDSVLDDGDYLEGRIEVGDIITGWYSYDSSVTRLSGDRYEFRSAPSGVAVSVSGLDFMTDPSSVLFEMDVGNDLSWGDTYFFISFNNLPLSNGTLVDGISWSLKDPSGTALSSDALPTTGPILDQWGDNRLRLHGERGRWGVDATVTTVEVIPEPATLLLLSFGGTILARTRLRKR